jgi:nucleoredoxin
MSALTALFGDNLLTKNGFKPTVEVLSEKKAIALYFSAHWCPPCRGFTPKLAEWYKSNLKEKGLEIVFVSSDRDQSAFDEYYGEQPWVSLPFEQRDLKAVLSKKFKVQGIPSVVILDGEGGLITRDGREAISGDPTGLKMPWTPPSKAEKQQMMLDCLGPELLAQTNGKPIGLYFSAHWCPPCRGFTPKLVEMYNGGLKDKMEIIFVSSDRDEGAFNTYFGEMPWLALPYEKRDAKEKLSTACGVEGIPTFAVINPDGSVVTTDGRSKVMKDPKAETFPEGWMPSPFNDVNDDPGPLNEEQCLIMLGSDAASHAVVKAVAEEHYSKAGKDVEAMEVRFFSGPDGGVTGQLRNLTKVEGAKLIMLDIPDDGAFYVCDSEVGQISESVVKQFLDDVRSKKAPRQQLQK